LGEVPGSEELTSIAGVAIKIPGC